MIPSQLQNNGNRFCLVRSNEKAPFEKDWQQNGYNHKDPRLIEWIENGGNLGILTGHGIVIFDCDCIQAERLARTLPETMVIGTSMVEDEGVKFRKKHFYFKSDLKRKQILKDHEKHLGEIQAMGQQCLIPPSVHPSGAKYEVLENRDIAHIDENKLIRSISPFITGSGSQPIKVQEIIKGVASGNRNESMIRLATFHRRAGATPEEALSLLTEQNKKNVPPLEERELNMIVESAFRTEKPYRYFFEKPPEGEYSDPVQFFEKSVFIPKRLAEKIMDKYVFKTTKDNETIYVYNNGYYQEGGDRIIKDECRKWLGELSNRKRVMETVFHVQISTYIDRYSVGRNMINMQNGIFDIESMTLIEHTPELFMTTQTPIFYNPEADCPKIKDFMNEILDPEDIPMIQELFGYCLYNSQLLQKAFLFYGNKLAGKSTLLRLLTEFLGKDNVSNVALQEFTRNRFHIAELFGKLANVVSDITDEAMKETGIFKQLVGEDRVKGERKHRDPFYFTNTAKMIFSCNKIPETDDHGDSYFRRWQIINFPNCFEGDNRDTELLDKLVTKEEMSGIFNWAVGGLKRLLESKKFTNESSLEETKSFYLGKSSDIDNFMDEKTEIDMESHIPKEELYREFLLYCKNKGVAPITKKTFTIKLQMIRPEISTIRIGPRGSREYAWMGIKWK